MKTRKSIGKAPCSIIGKSVDWKTVFFDSYDYRFKQVSYVCNLKGYVYKFDTIFYIRIPTRNKRLSFSQTIWETSPF